MDAEDEDDTFAVVIDNGSHMCKAGFAGQDVPQAVFPPIVETFLPQPGLVGAEHRDGYVGDQARDRHGISQRRFPIQKGLIRDWDDAEKLWHHTFYNELRIKPEHHNVLLTDSPVTVNTRTNRNKIVEIMFETFSVPGVYLSTSAVLALYASGRLGGIALDLGDSTCHAVPVHDGYQICNPFESTGTVTSMDFGGQQLTEYLAELLNERGQQFVTTGELEKVQEIKENFCYIALDMETEMISAGTEMISTFDKEYELPGGEVFTVKDEQFKCPEILFQPLLSGNDCRGVHQIVYDSIKKCDMERLQELYGNIVLCGGTSMFRGTKERLKKEMLLLPETFNIEVIAPPERKISAWIGGSILSSLSTFQEMWITKEEYVEHGTSIVQKKCF